VAVIGIGFLGALLTRLAVNAGAHVLAVSRRPFSLRIARNCGAHETLPLGDPEGTARAARAQTSDRGFDVVIEVAGVQSTLDLATRLTRESGRLVIAGYHQDGLRLVDLQTWNWRGLEIVNAHERAEDAYLRGMRDAIDAILVGAIDPFPLFTHVYPLHRIGEAFETMVARPDGFVKALATI
jgi:threonine dehydrogenase-like Zn-dependent dehydrogenase